MSDVLLPLFPLGVVLFPRTVIPLHIFEERYKTMIGSAVREASEFGIVQGGERGIVNAGCSAVVDRVMREYEDGRMDILAMGRRRFEILSLNDELEYLRGEVDYFEDEIGADAPQDLRTRAVHEFGIMRRIAGVEVSGDPDPEDPELSFQLAQIVPDLEFRQTLLMTRSESERLKRFSEYVPVFLARQRHAQHVKTIAPRNGHAKVKLG